MHALAAAAAEYLFYMGPLGGIEHELGCKTSAGMQGPVHAATTIFREEGLLGLWAGAAPTVMRNGTNQMCLFWAKNNFDGLFFGKEEGDGRVLAPWQSMLSGFSAACLGPIATGPFDVIKVGSLCPWAAAAGPARVL